MKFKMKKRHYRYKITHYQIHRSPLIQRLIDALLARINLTEMIIQTKKMTMKIFLYMKTILSRKLFRQIFLLLIIIGHITILIINSKIIKKSLRSCQV